MMGGGGGRGIPMCISTADIAGIGTTIINAKSVVPKSNFFILLSPFNNNSLIFSSRNGRHHGHHGHGHDATRGTQPTLKPKPTIKSSKQSFSSISPPLSI
jgi:hypothetical protein